MNDPLIRIQPKEKRVRNFLEVSQKVSKKTAIEEARRFPQPSNPAEHPRDAFGVDFPAFIRILREGDVPGALRKIREENDLPGVSARVCPRPVTQSAALNERLVDIRILQRFAADYGREGFLGRRPQKRTGKKIAVIGAGPTGLSAAAQLAKKGYQVTVFEAAPFPGGRMRHLIPAFRLPKEILDADIADIMLLGVELQTGVRVGSNLGIGELWEKGFCAALLACGTSAPAWIDLPGVDAGGVYYAEELLIPINILQPFFFMKHPVLQIGGNVLVMGSTDKALDCARICLRLGKTVTMVFEEVEEDLNVDGRELLFAKEEGLILKPLTRCLSIEQDNGRFRAMRCQTMDFAENAEGRWQIKPLPDSEFLLEADTLFLTGSQQVTPQACGFVPGLKRNSDGSVWADPETALTSCENVFAAGHLTAPGIDIDEAMAAGKAAAGRIDQYLKERV